MSSRILGADELGEKGESRFREICADARITCNPSTRDRTGWDFLVELPFEAPPRGGSLDKRPIPISSHVQVKTVWDSTETVKLRLSSAERLAKEPKPSFIYVFRVNDRLEFEDSFMIHILGENLAKILKRLRNEQKGNTKEINKKTITFTIKDAGARLAPTAAAFTSMIHEACEPTLANYISKKAEQLENLGYELYRYNGTITFPSVTMEALVDASLGLRELQASNFQIFETRFGIELPAMDEHPKTGTIRMKPEALTACKIVFTGPIPSKSAAFDGEIFVPAIPNLPTQYRKIHFRSRQLDASFTNGQDNSIKAHLSILKGADEQHSVAEWTNIMRLFRLISGGECRIEIIPKLDKFSPMSFELPQGALQTPHSAKVYDHLLERLQSALNVLSHTGAKDRLLKWESLSRSLEDIAALDQLIQQRSNGPELSFTTLATEIDLPEEIDLLTVNFLEFAGTFFAYSGIAHARRQSQEGDEVHFSSTRFTGLNVRELPLFPKGFKEFTIESQEANPCKWQFVGEPMAFDERNGSHDGAGQES